jgi:hypothetical protein
MAKVLSTVLRGLGPSNGAWPLGRLERRGNRPFEALGQWTHIRKSGTETVRPRCICQHKVDMGLGLVAGLRTESC